MEVGAKTTSHRSNVLIVSGKIDMEEEKYKLVATKK